MAFRDHVNCLPYPSLLSLKMNHRLNPSRDSGFHILITSYQLIVSDEKYLKRVKWQYMVLDEAQAIKSSMRYEVPSFVQDFNIFTVWFLGVLLNPLHITQWLKILNGWETSKSPAFMLLIRCHIIFWLPLIETDASLRIFCAKVEFYHLAFFAWQTSKLLYAWGAVLFGQKKPFAQWSVRQILILLLD